MTADKNDSGALSDTASQGLEEVEGPAPEQQASVSGDPQERESNLRSLWIPAGLLLLIIIAVNWPYQHVFTAHTTVGKIDTVIDFPSLDASPPVVGGWPYRFLIRHTDSAGDSIQRFSVIALLYDLGLAAFVSALLVWYGYRRSKRKALSAKNLTIADLMLLTGLLAAPFAWWQHAGAMADEQLKFASNVQRQGGACHLSSSIPSFLNQRLYEDFLRRLRRIRGVRMEQGDDQLVQQLVALPELNVLRLGGGDFGSNRIEEIVACSGLEDLRIAGRQLDSASFQAIRRNVRLHTLNLMRTNVTSESLSHLDTMPNLKRLNLIHSDVVTAELGSPPWSSTIGELRLSHPEPGEEASLRIADWPRLKRLEINELESQMNSTAMKVVLEDLPQLEYLGLDLFQKFDLRLRNLPSLASLSALDNEWSARIPRGGKAPGQTWVSQLDVDGLPELKELKFFARDLEHIRVVNSPKLALAGVGAFYRTYTNQTYAAELPEDAVQALIEGIGQSEGPETVDLDAVPLKGADLSPLVGNQQLTKLKLSNSGTTIDQWKQLQPMTWLKELTIQQNVGSAEAVPWVMKNFPNLEHFAVSSGESSPVGFSMGGFERFEVIDRPQLKTIDMGDLSLRFANAVKVVNSPKLAMPIKIGQVSELELVNANALTGLSVSGMFPRKAKLEGLDNLGFFAAGGPTVTDEVLQSIRHCRKLNLLTLAHPAVSEEALEWIAEMASLRSLYLPGAPLTDEVVTKWGALSALRVLDVSDTRVTSASLAKLPVAQKLEKLVLDRSAVRPETLSWLAKNASLTHLSLVDVGIDAKTLGDLLDTCNLEELDLSSSDVSPEVLNVIAAKGSTITFLSMRDCELDEKSLIALASKNPQLKMELSGEGLSTRAMTQLLSSGRITTAEDREMERQMQAMQSRARTGGGFMTFEREHPALIDTRAFANFKASPDGSNGQEGWGQAIPGSPLQPSASQPTGPPRSIGFQIGNWIGSALQGFPPTEVQESQQVTADQVDDPESHPKAKVEAKAEIQLEEGFEVTPEEVSP